MARALTLRLSDDMHEALRREAFGRRMPINELKHDVLAHGRPA